mmetsp:Transcript_68376/g.164104  ORF Transcript_68376/g.164104 Transcript_68376/m.164104 type:complete len:723 (+) Transcript_68376:41-2209(+)
MAATSEVWCEQYRVISPTPSQQMLSAPTGADSGAGATPVLPGRGDSMRTASKEAVSADLSWTDLEWYVKQPGGGAEKQVLFGLDGLVRSGEMLAVMGPSGCGKSTLLDILAMRKSSGRVKGSVRVNGLERRKKHYNRASAYVAQDDTFLPTLTVEETLEYYAALTLPRTSRSAKNYRINEVLKLVGLERSRKTKVGGTLPGGLSVRGCSGGERKRLNLATAMLARPSLIFVDEPTSGLDAFASLRVLETIRGLCFGGSGGVSPAVVLTVHQPRSAAWQIFDQLYLLSEGHLMYSGPADKAAEWFGQLGYRMGFAATNPADWLVDLVTIGFDKGEGGKGVEEEATIRTAAQLRQASIYFSASQWMINIKVAVNSMVPMEIGDDDLWPMVRKKDVAAGTSDHASFAVQFRTLLWRNTLSYRRNLGNVTARLALSLCCGLLIGASYYGLQDEVENIPDRLGVLFFICMVYLITPCASMSLFVADRRFYSAEAAAQLYGALAYYLVSAVCETFVNLIAAGLFWSVIYPMANLRPGFRFFAQGAVVSGLLQLCGAQIANLAALITPNQELAFVVAIAFEVTNFVSAGYLVRTPDLPAMARWFRLISPCKYGFQALSSNEYAGKAMDREGQLQSLIAEAASGGGPLAAVQVLPGGQQLVNSSLKGVFEAMNPCFVGTFQSGTEVLECVHLTEPTAEAVLLNASMMVPLLLFGHVLGLIALKVLYRETR